MEENFDRELEAILKLIKLTQQGVLKWSATKPWGELVENEVTKYTNVFFCDYENKRLRIFTEKKRKDKPSGIEAGIEAITSQSIFSVSRTYPYWVENLVLEVTNQNGQSLWRFPNKPATSDLLSAVKYSAAGVKDLLDSLLSKSE